MLKLIRRIRRPLIHQYLKNEYLQFYKFKNHEIILLLRRSLQLENISFLPKYIVIRINEWQIQRFIDMVRNKKNMQFTCDIHFHFMQVYACNYYIIFPSLSLTQNNTREFFKSASFQLCSTLYSFYFIIYDSTILNIFYFIQKILFIYL